MKPTVIATNVFWIVNKNERTPYFGRMLLVKTAKPL